LLFSVLSALAATFMLTIGVLAGGAPSGPGNASANASTGTSDTWVTEQNDDGGAHARAGALVGETSSGTATAGSSAVVNSGYAGSYSSAFLGWESTGTANADADSRAENGGEADADAYAWIILGSSGKADATAFAEALSGGDAEAESWAKLKEGASGSVTANTRAVASNNAYADANADAILIDGDGNLVSWAWAIANGSKSDAYSWSSLYIGSIPDGFQTLQQPVGSMLEPGVFFDYGVSGSSYGIALLLVLDPTNIYSFAISNAVDGNAAWAIADIEGGDVFVEAGAGEDQPRS
jgi:hypothetical protein